LVGVCVQPFAVIAIKYREYGSRIARAWRHAAHCKEGCKAIPVCIFVPDCARVDGSVLIVTIGSVSHISRRWRERTEKDGYGCITKRIAIRIPIIKNRSVNRPITVIAVCIFSNIAGRLRTGLLHVPGIAASIAVCILVVRLLRKAFVYCAITVVVFLIAKF
jgi:hypothetical protein